MKHIHSVTKQLFLLFFLLIHAIHSELSGHGFGAHTYVHLADNSIEEISMLCHRALDHSISVTTWDNDAQTISSAPIKRCGQSVTNAYVCIYIEHESPIQSPSPIICTLTQEFYTPSTHEWIAAHRLQPGDLLLCKNGVKRIAAIEYHQAEFEVYTLEIPVTHTFFVGWHGVLTHNMVLPAALSFGFSIPFGSATGSTLGSFFGPPTLVIGAVVGSAIGAFISMMNHDSIPSYTIKLGHDGYVQDIVHKQSASNNNASSNQESSSFFPMPNGPQKDDDQPSKRKKFSENKDDLQHIFRKKQGHFPEDTPEIRKIIEDAVNDATNYCGPDKRGHDWYSKILDNGTQLWAKVEGSIIKNAGINEIPKPYNALTGLCKPPKI